jgi:RluA family pseudouridine synthase
MKAPTLQILDEGPHHVVVDKMPDTLVVPARGVPARVLLEDVQARFGKGARAVHRLDRGTSGCVVFAKSTYGEQALVDAFRRRRVEKRYLAWVEGRAAFTKKTVDAPLLRVEAPLGKRGPAALQKVDGTGQSALTQIRVLASAEGFSLIEARPQSGRMHQIRVHCAHIGHPLVGDGLYGAKSEAPRVLLHALALFFPSPSGGRRLCESPLPPDFVAFAERALVDIEKALAPIRASIRSQREKLKSASPRPAATRASGSPKGKNRAQRGGGTKRSSETIQSGRPRRTRTRQ